MLVSLGALGPATTDAAYSSNRVPVQRRAFDSTSRRQVLAKIAFLGTASPGAFGGLASAAPLENTLLLSKETEEDDDSRRQQQQEAKQKKKEEEEARRLAEETKKRLAVGRIGTI